MERRDKLPPIHATRQTALLFVDPYNDFLSEGGKLWPRLRPVAEEVGLIQNLRAINNAVRNAGIRVFIAPHRRWEPGDYEDWEVSKPHSRWLSSIVTHLLVENGAAIGIRNLAPRPGGCRGLGTLVTRAVLPIPNLDQQLRQHGVTHVIIVGLLANTCIESTGRYAMELGYHVTLVKDATAAFSQGDDARRARAERPDFRACNIDYCRIARGSATACG